MVKTLSYDVKNLNFFTCTSVLLVLDKWLHVIQENLFIALATVDGQQLNRAFSGDLLYIVSSCASDDWPSVGRQKRTWPRGEWISGKGGLLLPLLLLWPSIFAENLINFLYLLCSIVSSRIKLSGPQLCNNNWFTSKRVTTSQQISRKWRSRSSRSMDCLLRRIFWIFLEGREIAGEDCEVDVRQLKHMQSLYCELEKTSTNRIAVKFLCATISLYDTNEPIQ